jgi:hypothetical protein
MLHSFGIDPKAYALKDLVNDIDDVRERLASDNRPGHCIGYAEDKVPTAFIGNGNTIFVQPLTIERRLGLLELKDLGFGRRAAP